MMNDFEQTMPFTDLKKGLPFSAFLEVDFIFFSCRIQRFSEVQSKKNKIQEKYANPRAAEKNGSDKKNIHKPCDDVLKLTDTSRF